MTRGPTALRLTVAICTRNRAPLLARALEALARAVRPSALWELLVVDNGSTDRTREVLDRFSSELPLRTVLEPALGLSNARNAAAAHATGDYICWTDDDVIVDPGWLCAYEGAIRQWPDAVVFGGPIRAQFQGTPPAWLLEVWSQVQNAYAVRDLGDHDVPFDSQWTVPYGANFVVRTREQRLFPYDPTLGRRGRWGTVGEETAVVRAILSTGASGWWIPDASVAHWVPKERQTVAYLQHYFELLGRTPSELGGAPDSPRLEILRKYVRAQCARQAALLTSNRARWADALIEASMLRGRLRS